MIALPTIAGSLSNCEIQSRCDNTAAREPSPARQRDTEQLEESFCDRIDDDRHRRAVESDQRRIERVAAEARDRGRNDVRLRNDAISTGATMPVVTRPST
jgi:hypothetical protein